MSPAPAPPPRPPGLAKGRWLSDFGDLTKAEKRLVANAAAGEPWMPEGWNGQRPERASAANRIRSDLIRFLLLGGDADHPVHEAGVMLGGAWVTGTLSLRQVKAAVRLALPNSVLVETPDFMGTTLPELALGGSRLPGLIADGMVVAGDLFLNNGFTATGEVRLLGARIGGDLACRGGSFANADKDGRVLGDALSADGIVVTGSVFLTHGFTAIGTVRLVGAQIGGTLECSGGSFAYADKDGTVLGDALSCDRMVVTGGVFLDKGFTATGAVRLHGAYIGGSLECGGGSFAYADKDGKVLGDALIADGMVVTGSFFLRGIRGCSGSITLASARVGGLIDEGFEWPAGLILDGFHYDRIVGPTDAAARVRWLKRQRRDHLTQEFTPQPWEQLASVLRTMGHKSEAAEVAMAKQVALRKAGKVGVRQVKAFEGKWFRCIRVAIDTLWNPVSNWLTRLWHDAYGALSGYGYRPQRILLITLGLIALSSLFFYLGRHEGLIGPTDPLVHLSPTTAMCGTGGDVGAIYWTDPRCPVPPEYSSFQPFFYTLDVTLPLVDLHQEAEWGPLVTNADGATLWGGRLLRWLMWFDIIFGWVASLMFVAIVSRLVEKD